MRIMKQTKFPNLVFFVEIVFSKFSLLLAGISFTENYTLCHNLGCVQFHSSFYILLTFLFQEFRTCRKFQLWPRTAGDHTPVRCIEQGLKLFIGALVHSYMYL